VSPPRQSIVGCASAKARLTTQYFLTAFRLGGVSDGDLTDPPDALKKWMAHLAFGGLRPVLDLGEQFGLDPNPLCAMRLA